jgi:hypothetical protein
MCFARGKQQMQRQFADEVKVLSSMLNGAAILNMDDRFLFC